MKSLKVVIGASALACIALLAPAAQAQTLQVLTAGSSAQFGPFAVAAYQLAKAGGAKAYHYTAKTSNCSANQVVSPCYTSLKDNRTGGAPLEPGNLWVVWSTNGIWAYLSVDSTVGVRGFQSYPRASLALASLSTLPVSATSNYLFWNDGSNDTALTTAVYNALNNATLTAANTDIRPEDALFATNRAISLGYGDTTSTQIKSFYSATVTNPVLFTLSGTTDPISKQNIPGNHAFETIPVGAAPIVVLVNNSTLSAATNLKVTGTNNAAALFSGSGSCAGNLLDGVASSVALDPILREPLSGTMNTIEFTSFVLSPNASGYTEGGSQETGITTNPADQTCGSGVRTRAIGTGEEVNAVKGATSPNKVANGVGYSFFSYESTGGVASGTAADKYITLDGVDPIAASYTTGALPYCSSSAGYLSCPVTPGTSFPNLRKGTYRAWSLYRIVTDSAGSDFTTAQALATEAQTLVNNQIPDFVPFTPICPLTNVRGAASEPGLDVYREHFTPYGVTVTPNDGPQQAAVKCTINNTSLPYLTLGGQGTTNTEAGGDVGGVIQGPFTSTKQPTVPGPTGSRD